MDLTMKSNDAYSLLDIRDNLLLSRAGNLTCTFRMEGPEAYSLSGDDIDERDRMFKDAFRFLPDGSYVHKQDVFLKSRYRAEGTGGSFLDKADRRHFAGRPYLEHTCYLHFILTGLSSLEQSYVASPFAYKEELHKADRIRLDEFLESIENTLSILRNMRDTSLTAPSREEYLDYLARYTGLFGDPHEVRDLHFAQEMTAGTDHVRYLCIADESFLPEGSLSSSVRDRSLPQAGSDLYYAPLEMLGAYLPCSHIVNQVIYFEGDTALKEKVAANIRVYGSNSSIHASVKDSYRKLSELQDEMLATDETLVRSFFSVCIFDADGEEVERAEKKAREGLNLSGFSYYAPSYEHLAAVHLSSVPGQITCLPKGFLFLTSLSVSLCLWLHASPFRSDAEGIYVHDRLFQIPLKKDIWDAGKKRVSARNGMIIAGTGGGKSAFALNLTQQLIEQDYTVIVVEFGKSFSQLCKLYPDLSLHVDYDGETPLGINPFNLEGHTLDNANLELLSGIVQRYWKHMFTGSESEKETALNRFLQHFFADKREAYNFEAFYHFVVGHYDEILKEEHIPRAYFDLDSFRLNCGEFLPGGRYENVSKDTHTDFSGKRFIVFELTQIKQDRFLSNLVMSIIFSVIQKKLLSDRSKRGVLIFDEYAETAQMKDTATDTSIHSSVAFCYQKIRKENGAVYTIVQNPDQLPDDENTKNIISNTDMLYVLPTKEVIYRSIIDRFKITREAQQALMKSMRNNFNCARPYSECFMRMGENYATVTRLEFSPEKFLAFQTDGEIWSVLDEKSRRLGMEGAIREYLQEHPKKTKK